MPKVSEDYLAARRQHIVDSARVHFARNGFHATSMTDLLGATGLSAGAFYRYFDSKNAIIAAIAQDALGDIVEALTAAADEGGQSLGEAVARAMEVIAAKDDADNVAALAVQAWAESLRDPQFAAMLTETLTRSRKALARVVRRKQREGKLPTTVKADALMSVFFSLLPGYLVQRAVIGPQAVTGAPDAVRALFALN